NNALQRLPVPDAVRHRNKHLGRKALEGGASPPRLQTGRDLTGHRSRDRDQRQSGRARREPATHVPSRVSHSASAARIRAQLRVPLWKLVRSYFSFGACTRSSSSAKPTMIVSMPSTRLKSPTIGIEPPSPIASAFLPHSAASAARVRA